MTKILSRSIGCYVNGRYRMAWYGAILLNYHKIYVAQKTFIFLFSPKPGNGWSEGAYPNEDGITH